jgi:transposase
MVIAAMCRLNRTDDGTWLVPSQSKNAEQTCYRVNLTAKTCTCLDHKEGGFTCKHFFAAEFTYKRDFLPDGTMIEQRTFSLTEKKVYKQDWRAYNLAQSTEKHRFQELLFDLTRGIAEIPHHRPSGQQPHTTKDSLFSMVFKIYSTVSSRRFSCDLKDAHAKGYLTKCIPGMKVNSMMENPSFTPILKNLIAHSARPLRTVETNFAIDSSGFGSSKFERWYDQKYGVTRQKCVWVKTHIACGTKTNIVTAVRILDKDAGDAPQFVPLVRETSRGFTIGEVSADKAYASLENFEEVASMGGQAFIAFKSSHTGAVGGAFEKAFHYFQFKADEYMEHYHRRSNVESTFSAIKRKFGDSVRSKCDYAMVNEVLCKILAHNRPISTAAPSAPTSAASSCRSAHRSSAALRLGRASCVPCNAGSASKRRSIRLLACHPHHPPCPG